MKLTTQQRIALQQLVKGVREDELPEQTLGGYAGTGKTTLIKYLKQFFPEFGVCAYTGKAANVLRKKGLNGASTIHSRIYKPIFENGVIYFDLNPEPGCEGFIVDEASMVSDDIYNDLRSFGMPLIFVGDHGQLEPVNSDFNLMADPMYRLEEIHRNAGTIAKFAQHLRSGFSSRRYNDDEQLNFLSKNQITDDVLIDVDQVICAFNQTRVTINNQIRNALGYDGILNVGERVMCLKNNREKCLFNGMQGTVVNLYEKRKRKYMDFEFDGQVIQEVCYETKQFGEESYKIKYGGRDAPNPFDYAYCITAHKAQGDEWDRVLVLEQKCKKWDHRRWSYTAASRAKNWLGWVIA